MTGSPIFSINLTNRQNPSNLNYQMSIKKSQAILKHFIYLKFSVWFTRLELFSSRLPVKIVKTLNDRQSILLAESLRSFLDKSRKRKEESGKRKEERGKRKEERERRKEERGKRKKERGKRKEERGS